MTPDEYADLSEKDQMAVYVIQEILLPTVRDIEENYPGAVKAFDTMMEIVAESDNEDAVHRIAGPAIAEMKRIRENDEFIHPREQREQQRRMMRRILMEDIMPPESTERRRSAKYPGQYGPRPTASRPSPQYRRGRGGRDFPRRRS